MIAPKPAPSRKIRLAWWLGIYFAAQVPLAFYIQHLWHLSILSLLLTAMNFPMGLGILISGHFVYSLPARFQGPFSQFCITYLPGLIYFAHLGVSLLVRSRRVFTILLLILVVIVSLNLESCVVNMIIPDPYDGPND